MTLYAPAPAEQTERELFPAGLSKMVCLGYVDLGTVVVDYGQGPKRQRKIRLLFESMDYSDDNGPLRISRKFTFSMYRNPNSGATSALREFIENWRGKRFAESELDPSNPKCFSFDTLIGKHVQGNVMHEPLKDGGEYPKLTNVNRLDGQNYVPTHPTVTFNLDDFDQAEYESLTRNWREDIEKSPEFIQLLQQGKATIYVEDNDGDYQPRANAPQGNSVAKGKPKNENKAVSKKIQETVAANDELDDEVPFS